MEVRVRFPGRQASDKRNTVTFYDEATPFPLQFHFLRVGDTETGEVELRNVGFECGEVPRTDEAALEQVEITNLALRRVLERYPHWVELARHQLVLETARAGELAAGVKRTKPARLDRDWYRMIAAEYGRHVAEGDPAPVTAIARSHSATVSAASRWVKGARERFPEMFATEASSGS
jgi:hypothetical protein